MNIAFFAYDFPHKKSQDFLIRMHLYGFAPVVVISSPPVKLNLPKTILKDKYQFSDLIDTKELCDLMSIEHLEMYHDDDNLPEILNQKEIELAVVGGSRILKKPVIQSVPGGIINLHPGLIPENRGLNVAKWAIALDIPQGMTIHFIDEKVDRGSILGKYLVPVFSNDSLKDINLRVYELEVRLLVPILQDIKAGAHNVKTLTCNTGYHPPADEKIDQKVLAGFEAYKKKWAADLNGWRCKCGENLTFDDVALTSCDKCDSHYQLFGKGNQEFLKITN